MATTASALRRYHEATKHSMISVSTGTHRLDWANKPLTFKIYSGLERIEPPADIGRLCRYTNGVLRWRRDAAGEVYGFRAAPCTGALYHIELYLVSAQRPDLPAGLYHYSAHDHGLRLLRSGDARGGLLEAAGGFAALASAPIIAILTSTFWRNSWKYEARAYRHSYWDSGAILANLLALASTDGIAASVVMGFVETVVNQVVGADGETEAAVALVALGDRSPVRPGSVDLPDIDYPTVPLSLRQVRYPAIVDAHSASSLRSAEEVRLWHRQVASEHDRSSRPSGRNDWTPIDGSVDGVIARRRSTRGFGRKTITRRQLEALVAAATAPISGDAFDRDVVEPLLVVNAVDDMEAGKYAADLSLIEAGEFRRVAAGLALGQPIAGQAAVNLYLMSDLDRVFERMGERGYRVAQMAGGIGGGRFELAATALGLGATGLTFFDDEVTEFFGQAARGRQVMYLAAAGHPATPLP